MEGKRKEISCPVWQFLIFCGVGNEKKMKKFPKISVHFDFCGFVGIRGGSAAAKLAQSPPRPPGVSAGSPHRGSRHFLRARDRPPAPHYSEPKKTKTKRQALWKCA